MITIGYSTRFHNPLLQEYLKKSCGHPKVQIIEKVNNGEHSLTEVYNQILNESENDIVVLCHDDIYFEKNGWGNKILDHFKKSDYGILGVAGSTYLPKSGMWWEDRRKMFGIVNHEHEGKKWESKYSNSLGKDIQQTVLVDGLFIALSQTRIKETFNLEVNGFHFYDVDFCFRNYLADVKIGVIYDVRITHKSIGMTTNNWEDNRRLFVKKYSEHLPIKKILKTSEKLKILIFLKNIEELVDEKIKTLFDCLIKNGHTITSVIENNHLNSFLIKNGVKLYDFNNPPGYKVGDGKWSMTTPNGAVVSQPNVLYKISDTNYDVIITNNDILNQINSLYPEIEKIVLCSYYGEVTTNHQSIKKEVTYNDIDTFDLNNALYDIVNFIDRSEVKQKIKIISGHSEKGGSTTAFINLTNELNSKGFDCTFYGPHTWHLNKCKSGLINEVSTEIDDIVICHFIQLPERPNVKKVIFSIHEKNLFEIGEMKPFWDEVIFLHEEHRKYHKKFEGRYSLIPNLKEHLIKKEKSELDLIAGVIGTIDENKQTHISIKRALDDGCTKVLLFGSISEPKYYDDYVKPLLSDKVIHMGHVDGKQNMYDMIGRAYLSSISEVACLIKDECYSTGTKFFGNEATIHQVSELTNDEIINKWIKVFEI
jgi:hypothetical protein